MKSMAELQQGANTGGCFFVGRGKNEGGGAVQSFCRDFMAGMTHPSTMLKLLTAEPHLSRQQKGACLWLTKPLPLETAGSHSSWPWQLLVAGKFKTPKQQTSKAQQPTPEIPTWDLLPVLHPRQALECRARWQLDRQKHCQSIGLGHVSDVDCALFQLNPKLRDVNVRVPPPCLQSMGLWSVGGERTARMKLGTTCSG